MKRLAIVFVSVLLASGLVFGVGFEIGGGLRSLGMTLSGTSVTSGFEYDASVGLNIPLSSQFSLTLNGNLLGFSSGNIFDFSDILTNSNLFILLGGGRYTFELGSIKPFIGAGGGVVGSGNLSTLLSDSSSILPMVEVDGGVMVPFSASSSFFVKGALNVIFYSVQGYMLMVNLMQLTAGINF